MDIYLFDQLLRGNLHRGMQILDAGCGYGRNLMYLLREGFEVYALDGNKDAVAQVWEMAEALQPGLPPKNFRTGVIEAMPFTEEAFDAVLCNAVLHFAQGEAHFQAMVSELWRVLRPGGLLFCRLGSRIGMEFEPVGDGRYETGDGAVWFLVNEAMLMELTARLGGELVDPLKTTIVQGRRCMTTWVVRK